MPSTDDASDSMLLIEHEDVVARLEEEFESLWTRSVPLSEVSASCEVN